ncbi:MAG: hypothetical protein A2X82_20135 [Geobacteraceae bacterium GWC2_55_20]|nr:MAG: hypothetical protein A2X82_20135 [Geobacteraceae bacterium GWC2_55_20]OGU24443.1 MAG: hypothetical protein A2X85_09375 [Geobacteraceae bacterium GWF2_54_21]HCE68396.1 hypothetical protein [Geobacter sp.]
MESKRIAAQLAETLTYLAHCHPTMTQLVSEAIAATGKELGSITLDELQAITTVAEARFANGLGASHRPVEGKDFITIPAGKDFLDTLRDSLEVLTRSSMELILTKRTIERECPYTDDKVIETALHTINTIAGNLADQWDAMDMLFASYDLYEVKLS